MTNVNIDNINGITVVSVSGHAGYSSQGDDIVCAALSTITQSLLETLKAYEKQGKCRLLSEELNEQLGCCLFSFKSSSKIETDALMNMAMTGFSMLENAYPKNIFLSVN